MQLSTIRHPMAKLVRILGNTLGIVGLVIATGILFFSYQGLRYGIHIGMNSEEAERKLSAQGFQVATDPSEFTEETATKYFQKGNVLVGIHWEYELTPIAPPGSIYAITVEEITDR